MKGISTCEESKEERSKKNETFVMKIMQCCLQDLYYNNCNQNSQEENVD
jgi:hypothetical protein